MAYTVRVVLQNWLSLVIDMRRCCSEGRQQAAGAEG
jgi:hypothetical protein